MRGLLRTRPGFKALTAAAVAALTLVPVATAEAVAAPAPPAVRVQAAVAQANIDDGQSYVLAPQQAPDQWLGENGWNDIVAQTSRLWYGAQQYSHALWTARVSGGVVGLENAEFHGSLQDDNGAVEANWGNGDAFGWTAVAGPSGSVALQNRATGRYLALNAANAAVMATGIYYWYLVNAHA
ncbi:hypothetical protein ACFV0O_03325 [Kitasatospora sp. NPDC059577]|uniref:hypothetical protein n=1 Tax=Kitasatospora sp. NPDC059577 TaxID=3346873 RepID=UPI003686B494